MKKSKNTRAISLVMAVTFTLMVFVISSPQASADPLTDPDPRDFWLIPYTQGTYKVTYTGAAGSNVVFSSSWMADHYVYSTESFFTILNNDTNSARNGDVRIFRTGVLYECIRYLQACSQVTYDVSIPFSNEIQDITLTLPDGYQNFQFCSLSASGPSWISTRLPTVGSGGPAPTMTISVGSADTPRSGTIFVAINNPNCVSANNRIITIATINVTQDSHTVTFKDWNDSIIDTQTVTHGSAASQLPNPSREGYTFTGWDRALTNITENTTITAQYTINTYPVTFQDFDETIIGEEQTVNYGSSATPPADPFREGNTFAGWDVSFNYITQPITVTAQYTMNEYIVLFQDWDGTVLERQSVIFGANATAPQSNPSRVGHTFDGWGPESAWQNVSGPVTITAGYTKNKYTVTFQDMNGSVIGEPQEVEYGSAAIAPPPPDIPGWTFSGWDNPFNYVTNSLTVNALPYTQNLYTVTFYNGTDEEPANIIDKQSLLIYGDSAVAPPIAPKVSKDEEHYRFKSWDKDFSNITGNMNIHAEWSKEIYAIENIVFSYKLPNTSAEYIPSDNIQEGIYVRKYDQYWEIYGILSQAGEYSFSVSSRNDDGSTDNSLDFIIVVEAGTSKNVSENTDRILEEIGSYEQAFHAYNDAYFYSPFDHTDFKVLYIDGKEQIDKVDFEYEYGGSTKITIYSDTAQQLGEGTHTFCAEFRELSPEGEIEFKTSAVVIDVEKRSTSDSHTSTPSTLTPTPTPSTTPTPTPSEPPVVEVTTPETPLEEPPPGINVDDINVIPDTPDTILPSMPYTGGINITLWLVLFGAFLILSGLALYRKQHNDTKR